MQIVHWEYENKQATFVQPCVSCDLYADLTSDQKYQKLINPFQKKYHWNKKNNEDLDMKTNN